MDPKTSMKSARVTRRLERSEWRLRRTGHKNGQTYDSANNTEDDYPDGLNNGVDAIVGCDWVIVMEEHCDAVEEVISETLVE